MLRDNTSITSLGAVHSIESSSAEPYSAARDQPTVQRHSAVKGAIHSAVAPSQGGLMRAQDMLASDRKRMEWEDSPTQPFQPSQPALASGSLPDTGRPPATDDTTRTRANVSAPRAPPRTSAYLSPLSYSPSSGLPLTITMQSLCTASSGTNARLQLVVLVRSCVTLRLKLVPLGVPEGAQRSRA